MMRARNILIAALCAAALSTAGCVNKYARNHMAFESMQSRQSCNTCAGKMVVAVMPFQGVSESPGSGLIVADILANELYALGGYVLVTPEEVAARAVKREGEVISPAETGRMVGARYIITGRVTEYTYKSGVGEQPAVGITARLIETDTGRVRWSATRARTGSAAWFQEDSLALLTSRLCRDIALSVKGYAVDYGYASPDDDFYADMHPVIPEPVKAPAAAPAVASTAAPVAPVSAPVAQAPVAQAPIVPVVPVAPVAPVVPVAAATAAAAPVATPAAAALVGEPTAEIVVPAVPAAPATPAAPALPVEPIPEVAPAAPAPTAQFTPVVDLLPTLGQGAAAAAGSGFDSRRMAALSPLEAASLPVGDGELVRLAAR